MPYFSPFSFIFVVSLLLMFLCFVDVFYANNWQQW
jgi:hypothetical protein